VNDASDTLWRLLPWILGPAAGLVVVAVLFLAFQESGPGTARPANSAMIEPGSGTQDTDGGPAEAKALFEKWLKAQNNSDFETYKSLYAKRFEGLKRSGLRTYSFDRDGWIKDRRHMFKRKMAVEADDVSIVTTKSSALVHFTQTWASGNYKDVGPKQLVLVRENGGFKISREEMLQSIIKGKKKLPSLPLDRFAYVIDADGSHVVLHTKPKDRWSRGIPRLILRDRLVIVRRAVDATKLPPEILRWRDQKFRLFDSNGVVCEATVTGFAVIGRVVPHFGTEQAWDGEMGNQPMSKKAIAKDAWDLSKMGGHVLTGELDVNKGDCAGALWAQVASLPIPVVTTAETPDKEIEKAALAAFRKLRAYKKIAGDYREEVEVPRASYWEKYDGAKPKVLVMRASKINTTLVSVSANSGNGCGEFEGSLWAIWEVTGDPKKPRLILANDPANAAYTVPIAAIDADGNGTLEILYFFFHYGFHQGLIRSSGATWDYREELEIPIFDCGC